MKIPKQTGFTMLEVLVTMVILSFGLLGIAGIIANGLKNNQSSYARSQASWLANDMVDRMRANRAAAEVGTSPYNLAIGTAPTGTTIAATDLIAWRAALAATLPSGTGTGSVSVASSGANPTYKVTVVVQWDDSRARGGGTTEQFSLETRL